MQHSSATEVQDEPEPLSILLRGGKFYHGPNVPCAPHLPVGSPERAALFERLGETFSEDWAVAERAVEAERRAKLGSLYFVTAGSAVKIGRTTNMSIRLRHIQAHNHKKVECVVFLEGEGWRERDYHRKFRAHRLHGEWFERVPEIEDEIAALRDTPKGYRDDDTDPKGGDSEAAPSRSDDSPTAEGGDAHPDPL